VAGALSSLVVSLGGTTSSWSRGCWLFWESPLHDDAGHKACSCVVPGEFSVRRWRCLLMFDLCYEAGESFGQGPLACTRPGGQREGSRRGATEQGPCCWSLAVDLGGLADGAVRQPGARGDARPAWAERVAPALRWVVVVTWVLGRPSSSALVCCALAVPGSL